MSSPKPQPNEEVLPDAQGDSEDFCTETITNRVWYRTVFFQATVIGLCAFFAPGLYNAMQSTGAGGQQTPYLVMSANAVLGVMMVVTCSLGSVMANKIGLKNALIFGTTGYAIYSASLYTNNRYGTEWFVYVGSAACGITAGIFWAAEGAIMISYPEDEKRGRYLAYWLAYRNGGSIVGGAINLAFNSTGKTTGKLDWRTYVVFVALQCLGPFVALLLSPPEKVQRQDGKPVAKAERIPTVNELKAVAKILVRSDFLLVFPFFFYATFLLSYAGSFLSLYFSVRSRALASLVSALAQITANFFFGHFLDWTRFTINQRARFAYIGMMALFGGTWIWATIIQREYGQQAPALDWSDSGFGRGWALYILLQVNFALAYNYGYWLAGYMARGPAEIIRFTSTVRAVEAAGGAVASGISSTRAPLLAAVGVNFGVWGLALVPTYIVVHSLDLKQTQSSSGEEPDKSLARV
ncbi:cytochrome c oxidase subunit 1 [Colletotrichum karsti]|uniref:Cytochrome c oxidase subunit 1 n=1 Tax=Colletotrichum karsti TaxID=1095194 RepID=A0A9P6HWF5_9PEZI|nr:cytochrome c oxidase subunit 1 [Colletotrichum karsti]KAF9872472.1 cytochrome c oxidase subunit 1 [Colletotrichum karsti]